MKPDQSMTDIYYKKEARDKLLAGAEKLYDAVSTTLGPRGRNVVIGKRGFGPTVTHDGVTVARAVHIRDEAENIGAELIKEAASKLEDAAGDGTTTVTVLTYHLLKLAAEIVETTNISPMQLASEVEEALQETLGLLERLREPAESKDILKQIASVSAGSSEIGEVVAETVDRVGSHGTVTVQPSPSTTTRVELARGMQIDRGWLMPQFITDPRKSEAVYENAAVVVCDRIIYTFHEILPILEKIQSAGVDQCILIAKDVEGDALASILLNNEKGSFRTLVVKAPAYDTQQRLILEDIAKATDATVIAQDTVSLNLADMSHVGMAGRVIATRSKTTFMDCRGDLEGRIMQLSEQIEEADPTDKPQLEARMASLAGQVAIIHVGGQTETEIEEKKFRVDDAVAAAKAARAEGYLPGGGMALYHLKISTSTAGAKILDKVLRSPFEQLMVNANIKPDLDALAKHPKKGYDVKTGKLVNLVKTGIVDPYTVTKQALKTAVSLGVVGITVGALIVEDKK